jgi:hypothetical protein
MLRALSDIMLMAFVALLAMGIVILASMLFGFTGMYPVGLLTNIVLMAAGSGLLYVLFQYIDRKRRW